jgi:HAD superfamily hydrolase (TIGR01450 family)
MATRSQIVRGIGSLLERYDIFIIDQYGVLHNGISAYPGAVECFNHLIETGKKVVILSNTSRRSCAITSKLDSFGFSTAFAGAITGGEEANVFLKNNPNIKIKCTLMTYDFTKSFLDRHTNQESLFYGLEPDLQIELVDIEQADFLLVEGIEELCGSASTSDIPTNRKLNFVHTGIINPMIQQILDTCRRRDLLLVCTNPDLVAVKKDANLFHMGGKIAQHYESMGGNVKYFGKPERQHFEACIRLAGAIDRTRVVHIGDSLHHDIQGAINTGIDSIFIANGIHATELKLDPGKDARLQVLDPHVLKSFLSSFSSQSHPTYTSTGFFL